MKENPPPTASSLIGEPPAVMLPPIHKAMPTPETTHYSRSDEMAEPIVLSRNPPPADNDTPLVSEFDALQARVARALAVVPGPDGTYSPNDFVTALAVVHDKFVSARASLSRWEEQLAAKEAELARREHALKGAEQRASASLRLAGILPPVEQPKRKWFGRG